VTTESLDALCDLVVRKMPAGDILSKVDEVWTMTSLIGFEALMRGKSVTCLGAPFYAGWGLTEDRGEVPDRRRARPSLDQLVHAALIDYPMYRDPISGLICPPEVIVERLAAGQAAMRSTTKILAKAQGLLASFAPLWR
jgi:capsular polysaccharide export protein